MNLKDWHDCLLNIPKQCIVTFVTLEWNRNKYGNGITFNSNNRVIFLGRQAKIAANMDIKLDEWTEFIWEYCMHGISNYSWIGFVKAPLKVYLTNWNTYHGQYNDYAIGFNVNTTSLSIKTLNSSRSITTQPVRIGDKFRFKLKGQKKKTMEVFHNGRSLGIIWYDVFDQIWRS